MKAQLNFFIEPYWTKVVLEFPDREITVPLSDLLARHHAICCRSKETRDLFLFGQKIQTKPAFCPSLNYSRTDVLSMESILEKQTGDSKVCSKVNFNVHVWIFFFQITATPRFYSHREIISNGRTWYLNVLFRKYIKFCCRHHWCRILNESVL